MQKGAEICRVAQRGDAEEMQHRCGIVEVQVQRCRVQGAESRSAMVQRSADWRRDYMQRRGCSIGVEM